MDLLKLSQTELFKDISTNQINHVLKCLNSRTAVFDKGEVIFSVGDKISEIGLVIYGSVLIEHNDLWGNRSILGIFKEGSIFAESFAYVNETLKVDVIAAEDTEVLFLDAQSVITTCKNACFFHTQLIHNLLSISSNNNILLSERILNTSSKTIRGRIITYLSQEAYRNSSNVFTIPLNRQELADYLNVDRSALSNELGKMRDEGLLSFYKNKFEILDIDM